MKKYILKYKIHTSIEDNLIYRDWNVDGVLQKWLFCLLPMPKIYIFGLENENDKKEEIGN